jgi:hypothetical protein
VCIDSGKAFTRLTLLSRERLGGLPPQRLDLPTKFPNFSIDALEPFGHPTVGFFELLVDALEPFGHPVVQAVDLSVDATEAFGHPDIQVVDPLFGRGSFHRLHDLNVCFCL